MLVNPLFAKDEDDDKPSGYKDHGYVFHNHKGKTLQPMSKDLKPAAPHARSINTRHHYPEATAGAASSHHRAGGHHTAISDTPISAKTSEDAAVELIRRKVAALYDDEPDVKEELQQVVTPAAHASKHQRFMNELSGSGKSLAQIQAEWHQYYLKLPDDEKHEVWREFYQTSNSPAHPLANVTAPKMPGGISTPSGNAAETASKHRPVVRDHIPNKNFAAKHGYPLAKAPKRLKRQILEKVALSANTQAKAKQHFQSLVFGVVTGLVVLAIFLFGFFNEMFIAPFIQPSRHVSATPIILNSDSIAPSETPEVIIPKINVQIPVVYDQKSVNEADIQGALERGVVHYATTVLPGQQGNAAVFGHSSNNIFNKGKYKFAFVLLHELVPGDIFYLTYGKTVYSYRVYDKKIVLPTETSVLSSVPGKPATATLITCDPPGTSTNRLVVWGEQVSPNPAGAAAPSVSPVDQTIAPAELPSEGPTAWNRFWNWLF